MTYMMYEPTLNEKIKTISIVTASALRFELIQVLAEFSKHVPENLKGTEFMPPVKAKIQEAIDILDPWTTSEKQNEAAEILGKTFKGYRR